MRILYALFLAQFFIVAGLAVMLLFTPSQLSDLTAWAMAGMEDGSLLWQLGAFNAALVAAVVGIRLPLRRMERLEAGGTGS